MTALFDPIRLAATAPGHAHTYSGKQPYTAARPLRVDVVPALLEDFRRAARNAMQAGFDGVQVHAANGYLIDQFLRDGTNFRNDAYGGLDREPGEAVTRSHGNRRGRGRR